MFKEVYLYFITLPDRLYPFRNEIEGKLVRGQRSYEQAVKVALEKYGLGRLGYRLMFYRETFHFLGSILFIISATVISKNLFGSDAALYVLLLAAIVALAFQEFYVHPKSFGQRTQKGIADWLVWVAPMVIYLLLFR
ncbi:MAG: hypothetical protein V4436_01030 [Patescibacteria group bacterium]